MTYSAMVQRAATPLRLGLGLATIAALLMMSTGLSQAHGVTSTAVALKDTWQYRQVAHNAEPGFAAVDYDDSAFATGQAGFGTTVAPANQCTWNRDGSINTAWAANTDLLLRKHVTLPAGAHNLRVTGTIDNNAVVYVNGTSIGTATSGNCIASAINLTAPDALLNVGDNLIAIRAIDLGGSAFIDVLVTYEDAPAYGVCTLYDQAKAHKSGSTVPVKLQICDENGNNLSSESIVVQATGLKKVDDSASADVEDSGSANSPDNNFRYDTELGGYIYNLSTKGLTTGTWVLSFTIDGEVENSYSVQFDVK